MTTAMPRPLRILVTGWEGGGNVPPFMEAIRALTERGHEVRLIGDNSMAAEAARAGARHLPWLRAPNRPDRSPRTCFIRDWLIEDSMDQFRAWATQIFVGPAAAHARDVADALREEPADLVLGSDLLFGGMLGAELARVPLMTLATNVSIEALPGHPPFGPGFQPATNEDERRRDREVTGMVEALWNSFLSDLNGARASMGLEPLARTLDQLRYARRHLLATSAAFDFPSTSVPEKIRYVGPLLQEPDWALPADLPDLSNKPVVLVAFSTTFQGQDKAIASVIEAARDLPFHIVVTLGKAMEGWPLQGHANATILGSACHDALLAHAVATLTHGGHGTTMRSLRHGVPLLVLPMGRDQNENAARVEYHGAGLQLAASAGPEEIAAALRRLVTEPHFAANARRVAAALAAEGDSRSRLVAEIEAVAWAGSETTPETCAA